MNTKSLSVVALVALTTLVTAGCVTTTITDDTTPMIDTGTIETTMPTDETATGADTTVSTDDYGTMTADEAASAVTETAAQ